MTIETALKEALIAFRKLQEAVEDEYLRLGRRKGELSAQFEIRKIYFGCLSRLKTSTLQRRTLEIFFGFWVLQKPPEIVKRATRKRPSLIDLPTTK